MEIFISIVLFVLIFGLIIFLHELGHFLVAKWQGMRVKEFAFGFPPRLFSRRLGETRFSFNLIPLGGYVSILGEDEDSTAHDSFSQKSPWSRLKVVLAGVTMNILLAWVLLTVWFWIAPFAPKADAVAITAVSDGSPAEEVDLRVNDFIVSATDRNGRVTEFLTDVSLSEFTAEHRGEMIEFLITRNGGELKVPVTLSSDESSPSLGVSIADLGEQIPAVPWWQAPWYALLEMVSVTLLTLKFLGDLILGLLGLVDQAPGVESVSGPVGIFVFLRQTLALGAPFVLRYAALISLAVAIFNLLPIPALDGGRAMFLVYEGIFKKRALSHQTEAWIHAIDPPDNYYYFL